ncbi:hypothetical protein Acr_28g0007370 [Actinidia rufa]|uniref:Uncharacterized protein n=1 Tax=Actinidia rufa TaxID=165716 RepID=A0A7J0HA89_9ERIC|nr:hypothetical protein Acr_28g0007370 [Actinidia rufa]
MRNVCFQAPGGHRNHPAVLFVVLKKCGVDKVVVDVKDGNEALNHNVANGDGEGIGEVGSTCGKRKDAQRKTSGMQLAIDGDVVPSFYSHKKKVLKSEKWVHGTTGFGQDFHGGAKEFRKA